MSRPARVLVVGKFPPIQGGVSAQTFATSVDLASSGYTIDVITNADEVETNFRSSVSFADVVSRASSLSDGRVSAFSTGSGKPKAIPHSKFFAEKIYGLGVRIIEREQPDFIVGWYLIPYGFVSAALARRSGRPLILCHAGSDLARLALDPDLRPAISDALAEADRVLTFDHPSIKDRMDALGIGPQKRAYLTGSALSGLYFPSQRRSTTTKRPQVPTLLHYSKIGDVKGTFELAQSLARLAVQGLSFRFLCVELGWPAAITKLKQFIGECPALSERTTFVPPVAPWDVRDLLESATLVACLERRFDVVSHTPKVPREVLASGTALLVSREIARKQPFSRSLVHGKTALVVEDPSDSSELDRALNSAFSDPQLLRSIGVQGKFLSHALEAGLPVGTPYARAIDQWWRSYKPASK